MRAVVGILVIGAAVAGCSAGDPTADESRRYVSSAAASAVSSILAQQEATPTAAPGPVSFVGAVNLAASDGVHPDWGRTSDGGCTGTGKLAPIKPGDGVTVQDSATGRVLLTTTLAKGDVEGPACSLGFTVANAPSADEYVIEVGGLNPVTKAKSALVGVVNIDATD